MKSSNPPLLNLALLGSALGVTGGAYALTKGASTEILKAMADKQSKIDGSPSPEGPIQ